MRKILVLVSLAIIIGLSTFVIAQNWAQEYGVSLNKGWNLVYGLSEPSQLEAGSFDPSHIKAIYAFIPQTQTYFRTWPSPSFEDVEQLKKIISEDELIQTAFWVYSDSETGEIFNGIYNEVEYGLQATPVSYTKRPLYKGWNFVGITLDMKGLKINDAKGNCDIIKVCAYTRQSWECLDGNNLETQTFGDQTSDIGKGLIIQVLNNCSLGETQGDTPSVPSLPDGAGTSSCTDSDGGKDYYSKGTLKGPDSRGRLVEVTDLCVATATSGAQEPNVREYFCQNGIEAMEEYICPKGCSNGACI